MSVSFRQIVLNLMRYTAALRTMKYFSDRESAISFAKLVAKNSTYNQPYTDAKTDPRLFPFRMKPLGGEIVYCRSGLSDLGVLYDTFVGQYHLPPPDLTPVQTILDLGSNIGLTMAHYAALYPEASILGIELDQGNYDLCRKNVERYGERCRVIHGAVWHEAGEVAYGGRRESGYAVMTEAAPGTIKSVVPASTVGTLIDEMNTDVVDFVKMDIEGAEREVLGNAASWIQRVRCIQVEVHPSKASGPYTLGMCIRDLEGLGFACEVDRRHHASVLARNQAE